MPTISLHHHHHPLALAKAKIDLPRYWSSVDARKETKMHSDKIRSDFYGRHMAVIMSCSEYNLQKLPL